MSQDDIDPRLFRLVMGRFATGVTVITTRVSGETYGMTANAFMAGSLAPPLCVISINKAAQMHRRLEASRRYGVSILSEEQQHLAGFFARQKGVEIDPEFIEVNGVPLLERAVASITATVTATSDCGDHTLFIGRIDHMEATSRLPLVFHAGRYARIDRAQPIEELEPPMFW